MKVAGRRTRICMGLVLCSLVLLASAERRLAYLDFNAMADSLRIENDDKVDGDELIDRLVFVDDATEPRAPEAYDASWAAFVPIDSCALCLITVKVSESRAPPSPLPTHA
jgi:hypothetical protein